MKTDFGKLRLKKLGQLPPRLGTGGGLASLWQGGWSGFLYHPLSDLSHLFTTAAGSTNVAANDDPVGRIVDFSSAGNNALQATTTRRPLFKAGAKPYLSFDGSDDSLVSSYTPNAAAGLTFAVAFNTPGAASSVSALGGGNPTTNNRAMIGLTQLGDMTVSWGESLIRFTATDLRNANQIILVQGVGASRSIWLNGVDITPDFAASTKGPDGTGGELTLAGRQNAPGGTPDQVMPGKIFAAMAINREVTASERAQIFSTFMGAF